MTLAARASATSVRLINKYGDTVAITRVTAQGTYNSNTGIVSAPTTAVTTLKASVKDVDLRIYGASTNLLLKTGDKVFLIASASIAALPSIADTILHASITYTIVPVHEGGLATEIVSAQDTSILYRVHGRKT